MIDGLLGNLQVVKNGSVFDEELNKKRAFRYHKKNAVAKTNGVC